MALVEKHRDCIITPKLIRDSAPGYEIKQIVYRFKNNYGASVVQGFGTYGADDGLFELAVLEWYDEEKFHITYDTPLTNDVLGYLTPEDVEQHLDEIEALPNRLVIE